jgi:hypothetical protein
MVRRNIANEDLLERRGDFGNFSAGDGYLGKDKMPFRSLCKVDTRTIRVPLALDPSVVGDLC